MIRGVIIDHTALLLRERNPDGQVLHGLGVMLQFFQARGLKTVVFSTHTYDIQGMMARRGFPAADAVVMKKDVGAGKGSPLWMQRACESTGLSTQDFVYIGDDEQDWWNALNSCVLYLHAGWSKQPSGRMDVLYTPDPSTAMSYIVQFLLHGPLWEYTWGIPGLQVRCLMDNKHGVPSDNYGDLVLWKLLKNALPGTSPARIGGYPLHHVLVLHAISSMYLEGIMESGCYYTVYPSSTPGNSNPMVAEFVSSSAKFFRNYYKPDLFERWKAGRDTSRVRADGGEVSLMDQSNTVRLNPDYADKLPGKAIVVFDDFHTAGTTSDWAYNLLMAAGCSKVTIVTVGKYGSSHSRYRPTGPDIVKPFGKATYDVRNQFTSSRYGLNRHSDAATALISLLSSWASK